jgi:hypothetical protein
VKCPFGAGLQHASQCDVANVTYGARHIGKRVLRNGLLGLQHASQCDVARKVPFGLGLQSQ